MLEYDSELHDDFEAAIARTNERFVDEGEAFDVVEAYTDATRLTSGSSAKPRFRS